MTVVAAAPVSVERAGHPLLVYVVKRLLAGVGLAFVVSVLTFVATQVLPGDSARAILGRQANPVALEQLRQELGLDRPLWEQYWSWLSDFVRGDLGISYASRGPVSELIGDRIVNSLILACAALLVIVPLSLVIGTLAGVRRGKPVDHVISGATLTAVAIPEFVTGTLLAALLAIRWGLLPAVSLVPIGETPLADPAILVLPVLTLTIAGLAANVRMVRGGVADQMQSEYVEATRLNGVPEGRVIRRHVLRNSIAPTVQTLAMTVQWLIGGVIVVEAVFQYPGIGQSLVAAVNLRDAMVVQSLAFLIALVYIFVNIAADIAVVLLVPKLRTSV